MAEDHITIKVDADTSDAVREFRRLRREVAGRSHRWRMARAFAAGWVGPALYDGPWLPGWLTGLALWLLVESVGR